MHARKARYFVSAEKAGLFGEYRGVSDTVTATNEIDAIKKFKKEKKRQFKFTEGVSAKKVGKTAKVAMKKEDVDKAKDEFKTKFRGTKKDYLGVKKHG